MLKILSKTEAKRNKELSTKKEKLFSHHFSGVIKFSLQFKNFLTSFLRVLEFLSVVLLLFLDTRNSEVANTLNITSMIL